MKVSLFLLSLKLSGKKIINMLELIKIHLVQLVERGINYNYEKRNSSK
ncbi:hypothetical protein HMPREF0545_0497 [Ligilactobacillus salivarius DSM 20555 = ATCC 11741]|uniref:Uncharacterized protein n=1 Tax=Ligilactobacillus salivarius DSM 20555 = ATCC 11741 TaxID=1423799 RepID=C2EFS5_9LACO|nr:hypothetical protein HMPREF0545_0497 [Ligilactobacillus salivarius DSM 20555 = ATCC 11741]